MDYSHIHVDFFYVIILLSSALFLLSDCDSRENECTLIMIDSYIDIGSNSDHDTRQPAERRDPQHC